MSGCNHDDDYFAWMYSTGLNGTCFVHHRLSFVPIVSGLREYAETLESPDVAPQPHRLYRNPNTGRWVADVFPDGLESLLFGGFKGELWLNDDAGAGAGAGSKFKPSQAKIYQNPSTSSQPPPSVGLVLGAGNQTPVAALDILHVLITENKVVVCKMNPVLEYMGPYLREAFQPLVDKGFLEFVYGGAKEGAALCNHQLVSSVHLTGSAATYDAIVWNGQPKVGAPPFSKPVGAELGCVTPYIIVPGDWSESDIEYHAETVATGLTQNAGHNCLKAELVVTDRSWPQRTAFLDALRRKLAQNPNRVSYYPGSKKKVAAFKKKFPDAEEIWSSVENSVDEQSTEATSTKCPMETASFPWILQTGLTPENASLQDENWCGVLQEVGLGSENNVERFLEEAVKFANEKCWGTLSCVVIAHPKTQKKYASAFEGAVEGLKYGSICINVPGTMGFAITKLGWGGYPGMSTAEDVGSGNCMVHNTLMYDNLEKSVLRGPWRFHPKPFWLTSHRNAEKVSKLSLNFMANPSLLGILPMAGQALLG